jgi:hypothetical protein
VGCPENVCRHAVGQRELKPEVSACVVTFLLGRKAHSIYPPPLSIVGVLCGFLGPLYAADAERDLTALACCAIRVTLRVYFTY